MPQVTLHSTMLKAAALSLGLVVAAGCAEGEVAAPALPEAPQIQHFAIAPPPVAAAHAVSAGSIWYDGVPGEGVVFFDYAAENPQTDPALGTVLADIVSHLPASYGNTYYDSDPITWGHETCHGIHAHLRNYHNTTGERANAFYIPGGKAALVVEPNIAKSDANAYVPAPLRGSRYDLYMQGSQAWDDTPLYIWDEWNAYANGAEVGIDLVQNGLWNRPWRDGVAGELEFVVYSLAIAMAVQELDPTYFESNTQFREFLAFNVKRSMDSYRIGSVMPEFEWNTQDIYWETFKADPSAETMRAFARGLFGEVWANAVIFGDGVLPDPQVQPPPADPNDPPPPPPEPEPDPQVEPPPTIEPDPADPNDPPPSPPSEQNPNGDPLDGVIIDLGSGGNLDTTDRDSDGIFDIDDLCLGTPLGSTIWTYGEWRGCAGGERRDRLPPSGGADADNDGVADADDLCSSTPFGHLVWSVGEWRGCAHGQNRDAGMPQVPQGVLDTDADGIEDTRDLCANTPAGSPIWTEGDWLGCAEGQFKD